MASARHTLLIKKDGRLRKAGKIIFGTDGSYYFVCPYHNCRRAQLIKSVVDLSTPFPAKTDLSDRGRGRSEVIEIGTAESEQIKMSHHPDGFVQFSGPGIISGRNEDGSAKGIGVTAWPLGGRCDGPAFGLIYGDIDSFEEADQISGGPFVLNADNIVPVPACSTLELDVHYLPPIWRRFIYGRGDRLFVNIVHPQGVALELPVLLMPEDSEIPGFLAFDLFTVPIEDKLRATKGVLNFVFSINSPTGSLRYDAKRHIIGEGVSCFYLSGDDAGISSGRRLDYTGKDDTQAEAPLAM